MPFRIPVADGMIEDPHDTTSVLRTLLEKAGSVAPATAHLAAAGDLPCDEHPHLAAPGTHPLHALPIEAGRTKATSMLRAMRSEEGTIMFG